MARVLDKLIVIDVESTCWEKGADDGNYSEIIEIGICVVDLPSLELEDNECLLIKPQKSAVSDFCHNLTTITQEQLDSDGISLSQACSHLIKKYNSIQRTWSSWGDYDRRMFDRQCRLSEYDAQYPFGQTHLNAKSLFAMGRGLKREVGMAKALELLHLELTGTHHRAVDDARNIGTIICHQFKLGRAA